jgi:hypothetical protein
LSASVRLNDIKVWGGNALNLIHGLTLLTI